MSESRLYGALVIIIDPYNYVYYLMRCILALPLFPYRNDDKTAAIIKSRVALCCTWCWHSGMEFSGSAT